MDSSYPLSIESFSYSWLINLKPSFENLDDSLDASDEASFIEMDPKMPPSKRFFRSPQDLSFDFPTSETSLSLVHADEIFSNGLLLPFFASKLKMEANHDSNSPPSPLVPSAAPEMAVSARKYRSSSLRRCRKLSKRIFHKYLDFLMPLFRRGGRGSGSRAGAIDRRIQVENTWAYSPDTSPRTSVAYSAHDWRMSCDSESSIHEAVLHCKRSIGK